MFPSAVLPRLFLGSQLHASNESILKILGITSVVNATELVPNYFEQAPGRRVNHKLLVSFENLSNFCVKTW